MTMKMKMKTGYAQKKRWSYIDREAVVQNLDNADKIENQEATRGLILSDNNS